MVERGTHVDLATKVVSDGVGSWWFYVSNTGCDHGAGGADGAGGGDAGSLHQKRGVMVSFCVAVYYMR
jgi:hypothetical protein